MIEVIPREDDQFRFPRIHPLDCMVIKLFVQHAGEVEIRKVRDPQPRERLGQARHGEGLLLKRYPAKFIAGNAVQEPCFPTPAKRFVQDPLDADSFAGDRRLLQPRIAHDFSPEPHQNRKRSERRHDNRVGPKPGICLLKHRAILPLAQDREQRRNPSDPAQRNRKDRWP